MTSHSDRLGAGAIVLRSFALGSGEALLRSVEEIAALSPFRQMVTPGGFKMSVASTNCGAFGWTSDRSGYRYTSEDPMSGRPWPSMPGLFRHVAAQAAVAAGFAAYEPDACLINVYELGARLTMHQDRNERDFRFPIVTFSLGIPAVFLFGGLRRQDKTRAVALEHGDVAVWGGPDRMRYHGIKPLKRAFHPLVGERRISLTFRKAA